MWGNGLGEMAGTGTGEDSCVSYGTIKGPVSVCIHGSRAGPPVVTTR